MKQPLGYKIAKLLLIMVRWRTYHYSGHWPNRYVTSVYTRDVLNWFNPLTWLMLIAAVIVSLMFPNKFHE